MRKRAIFLAVATLAVFYIYERLKIPSAPAMPPRLAVNYADAERYLFYYHCVSWKEAIPDAKIGKLGELVLPKRMIFLSAPLCELAGHVVVGQGTSTTVLMFLPEPH